MTTDLFTGHYDDWTQKRLGWILKTYGQTFFKGKTVLDIGGGRGHVAELILDLGATAVEVVEGRLDNIPTDGVREGLTFTLCNLERGLLCQQDQYDIVINFGVLYHLTGWERILTESVLRAREWLFMETEVVDSASVHCEYVPETAQNYDQSMVGIGSRPSEFELERILASFGQPVAFRKVLDGSLNSDFHRYDWPNEFAGHFEDGLRRYFAVQILRPIPDQVRTTIRQEVQYNKLSEVFSFALESLLLLREEQQQLRDRLESVESSLGRMEALIRASAASRP